MSLTVMEQLNRLIPLVRPKLPRLSRRHHTHHPLPRIHAKLRQCLNAVHHKVPRGRLRLLPAGVDVRPLAVYRYKIFWSWVAFCSSAGAGFLGWFEAAVCFNLWRAAMARRQTYTDS
jgi:hypothetical protein